MKINFQYIIIGLLLLATISQSCRKIIPTEIETKDKKIVFNGLISPEGIDVRISLSMGINDVSEEIQFINDAEITLYENDEPMAVLVRNKTDERGLYYLPYFVPQTGVKYTVKVDKAPYASISTSAYLPEIVYIDTITSFKETIAEFDYTYNVYSFYITINDPKDVENYYLISDTAVVYDYFYDEYNDTDTVFEYRQSIYLQSNDPVFDESADYEPFLVFSDETFNGTRRPVKVSIDEWSIYGDTVDMRFYLYSISKEYFLFLKSRALQMEQDEFSRILGATPVQVYSNIENGYGYFGAQSYSYNSILVEVSENYNYKDKPKVKK